MHLHRRLQHSGHFVIAGFVLVLALMLALAVASVVHIKTINAHMERIAERHIVEMDALQSMRNIVRERSLSIYAMFLNEDLFQRQEEYLRFTNLAGEFIGQRKRYEAINPCRLARADNDVVCAKELELYGQILALIRRSQPLQMELAERIARDDVEGVRIDLVHHDMPLEKEILSLFDRLIAEERAAVEASIARAQEEYRTTVRTTTQLGFFMLLLGVSTAAYVITRTRRIERDLHRQKERAEVTLRSVGDGVITADETGDVLYLNPVAEELTGWRLDEARGRPLREIYRIVDEATRKPLEHPAMLGCLDARLLGPRHTLLLRRDGTEYAVEDTAAPLRALDGAMSGAVLVFRDVTRSRGMERLLSWQASHDSLTGLVNRREFELLLERLIRNAREQGKSHVLLYLDLDQFKLVNDTCGHVAGDELLCQLAAMLTPLVRASDTLARLGGDEFGVLLEGCSIDQALPLAEKLRQAIADFRFAWHDKSFRVGVSVGIAAIDGNSRGAGDVLSAADAACYIAKDKGRNRIWVHQANDAEVTRREGEMRWVAEINRAFDEDRFLLYVQRILPLKESAAEAPYHEVLIRLVQPDGEVVLPMAFIPAAERYGLMSAIDRWVIARTFAWLEEHPRAGNLAINLSSQSLGDERLLAHVENALTADAIDPRRICFEITETAAIANWQRAGAFVGKLRARGCRFALDDFGSGMSSFEYLKHLAVDFIKIDGAFVRDMSRDPLDRAMVESINHIGHVLGKRTIAEYVENAEALEELRRLGVDYAQGDGLHAPEPLEVVGLRRRFVSAS
ncbi:diguanylate cyclase [Sulfurifustis variabilis]|uniref:Diguanylate cyclase n=1 Tax=Sulfurifustis variabilis TaxID=1675686 RepID=A0A1B4V0I9_9GAMM|nr:EAL domain-containing protein [Sulfurifustis variabilis]BAU46966.1 diguanylate cyclase [Sulfurifustis variabilis]